RTRLLYALDRCVQELAEGPDNLQAVLRGLLVEAGHLGTLHVGTERRRRLSRHKGIARRFTARRGRRSSGRTTSRPRLMNHSSCRNDPNLPREPELPRWQPVLRVRPEEAECPEESQSRADTRGTSGEGASSPARPPRCPG